MSTETVLQNAKEGYKKRFGNDPLATAFAPGRVNLLGEHTDYNGGLVLPMPLSLGTAVAIGYGGEPGTLRAASEAFEEIDERSLSEGATGAWSDYVLGSILALSKGEPLENGLQVMVSSNLPVGSGLSSSAAIEIGTMRALSDVLGVKIDPVEMAQLARSVENDFVGLPSGIMDQFSVSVGTPGNALFLDTRSLKFQPAPLPATHDFVIVHSGVGHKLTDNGYRERVAECQAACKALSVEMLSDLQESDLDRIAALTTPLNGRAKHIVTENRRVEDAVAALKAGDVTRFGELMLASHVSQRDDYEVSVPDIDALVEGAIAFGADGARLTGGGFGGSIVALVEKGKVEDWCAKISAKFPQTRILAVT